MGPAAYYTLLSLVLVASTCLLRIVLTRLNCHSLKLSLDQLFQTLVEAKKQQNEWSSLRQKWATQDRDWLTQDRKRMLYRCEQDELERGHKLKYFDAKRAYYENLV